MERGLIQFMMDLHSQKHGYTEMIPPFIVNSNQFAGNGSVSKIQRGCFSSNQYGLLFNSNSRSAGDELL